MVNRRGWLGAMLISFYASSCITNNSDPAFSLAQILNALPSIDTASELTQKFGEAHFRKNFNHDDPNNDYLPNRRSREGWVKWSISTPHNLIGNLPVGTRMLLYNFSYGSSLNPTGSTLLICIDKDDRIIGWMRDKTLVGYEAKAWARNPR